MRKFFTLVFSLFFCGVFNALGAVPAEDFPLVPAPKTITSTGTGTLKLPASVYYSAPKNLADEAAFLKSVLKKRLNISASAAPNGSKAAIVLSVSSRVKNKEGYTLKISPNGIAITGGSDAGVYYGICTLAQLCLAAEKREFPLLTIADEPRFGYRGMMLDPARNFIPLDDVKTFVETMSEFKFNVLHFHLSDDQGWRVEIKNPKYKKLMTVGAQKNKPKGTRGYYTQKEIKELVAFAQKHHVEIIPEIDMPGHNMGAIFSYPELTCEYVGRVNADPALLAKNPKMAMRIWSEAGVSEALLCAGKNSTYTFFNDVLGEICKLFPSKRFHIGGDEAPTHAWKNCKDCQALMKKKGLKSTQELMAYFFQKNFDALGKSGKTALYWYELDVPEYPKNAVMYAWRMGLTQQTITRARKDGYKVICCPGEHAYFDYPQVASESNHGWMALTTLEQAYKFDPGFGRPAKEQESILGCEGTLWGEYLTTIDQIFNKAYPRALALAEAGWTPMNRRGWDNFKKRAAPIVRDLRANDIPSFWPKDDFGDEK